MRFDIITIFPELFTSPLACALLKRAYAAKIIEVFLHNPRDCTTDRHRSVDDAPYGGGAGMVMRPEPIVTAVESVPTTGRRLRVLLTPQGEKLTQPLVREFAVFDQLLLVCGRYEGVDDRVRQLVIDREVSVGDYVVSGGEFPALLLLEAVIRCLPGALGNECSAVTDSFTDDLLEYPHYTRPEEFRGLRVPEVLLSGNHAAIERWRQDAAHQRTTDRRPDLLKKK